MSKQAIKRWGRTVQKHGHSLYVSLPHDLVKLWNLEPGQEMIVYQLNHLLVAVPMDSLLRQGEPKILQQLVSLSPLTAP